MRWASGAPPAAQMMFRQAFLRTPLDGAADGRHLRGVGLGALRILVIGIRRPVVGEPVLVVEEEYLWRAGGSVGRRYLLGLVVEKRKGEALFLGALLHVVDPVAEIAGIRVHSDEARAPCIVPRDVVEPILPGDHVRAVDAGENDGHGLPTEVLERMGLPVDCPELEGRGGVSERESNHHAMLSTWGRSTTPSGWECGPTPMRPFAWSPSARGVSPSNRGR